MSCEKGVLKTREKGCMRDYCGCGGRRRIIIKRCCGEREMTRLVLLPSGVFLMRGSLSTNPTRELTSARPGLC